MSKQISVSVSSFCFAYLHIFEFVIETLHHRRSFTAKNVDAGRTINNVEYCYTPVKKV